MAPMTSAPIILVPGYWLGAWAWDEVVSILRDGGHAATALTLPGLESADADRSRVTFDDHVTAIVDAVLAAAAPPLLAVHSGAGYAGYAASDRVPDRIAAMVYVDSAPGIGIADPEFVGDERPMVWSDLEAEENLEGISDEQKRAFRDRAVPEPGGVIRGGAELTNPARLEVPTTVIATAYSSEEYRRYAKEGHGWLAGLQEVRNISWVDLPTSHWPMWSRPRDLAGVLARIAEAHAQPA
jgi:pimeloyl-ACP methyl ester carboxylesterase